MTCKFVSDSVFESSVFFKTSNLDGKKVNIFGGIKGIKYKILLIEDLKKIDIGQFNINSAPSYCIVNDNKDSFAISKWVSPKRTRSYPFERVFNTLNFCKKITVIPIIKDEGADGDRDFIQWDTVSLMSLLDVFVIFAYYDKAEKADKKITNQKFNDKYVLAKIREIKQYHSSALHWNLNELNTNLHEIVDKVKDSYTKIEKSTGVKLHSFKGIENFKTKIGKDVSLFMSFSREKSEKAQLREFVTLQPKESLSTLSKAKITITNYLGGQYFFTVDEIIVDKEKVHLIECKHSKNSTLPSKSDIKDGLLKMILYCNLSEVIVDGVKMASTALLNLTSSKLIGDINSKSSVKEIKEFFEKNHLSKLQIKLVDTLMDEAKQNNFTIKIQYAK
ncbi:MAG TPA: hypothetical protein PLZ43_01930 [bacterium]|nr:hypothetical protein [bacterium]